MSQGFFRPVCICVAEGKESLKELIESFDDLTDFSIDEKGETYMLFSYNGNGDGFNFYSDPIELDFLEFFKGYEKSTFMLCGESSREYFDSLMDSDVVDTPPVPMV